MVRNVYNLSKRGDSAEFPLYLTSPFMKVTWLGRVKGQLAEFSYFDVDLAWPAQTEMGGADLFWSWSAWRPALELKTWLQFMCSQCQVSSLVKILLTVYYNLQHVYVSKYRFYLLQYNILYMCFSSSTSSSFFFYCTLVFFPSFYISFNCFLAAVIKFAI